MSTRAKKFVELSDNAKDLVESLKKLKDRLNSFEIAEEAMQNVSQSLQELIANTSTQVILSEQMLIASKELGIEKITEQIKNISEEVAQKSTGRIAKTLDETVSVISGQVKISEKILKATNQISLDQLVDSVEELSKKSEGTYASVKQINESLTLFNSKFEEQKKTVEFGLHRIMEGNQSEVKLIEEILNKSSLFQESSSRIEQQLNEQRKVLMESLGGINSKLSQQQDELDNLNSDLGIMKDSLQKGGKIILIFLSVSMLLGLLGIIF